MVYGDIGRNPGHDVCADGYRRSLLLRPMGAESGVRNVGRRSDHRSADREPLFRRNGFGGHLNG